MGCDIHGCVEVFLDGEWLRTLDIGDISPRNYALFSQFFGVRGSSLYEYKYRGFPAGVSYSTRDAFCEECSGDGHAEASPEKLAKWKGQNPGERSCGHCCDWHSLSYITMQEIEQHADEITSTIRGNREWLFVLDTMYFFSARIAASNVIVESTATLSTGMEDTSTVRLIVWFDN